MAGSNRPEVMKKTYEPLPMFCHSDIINYGNLHNIDFIRTQTLCQGGDCCDFRFVRHKKGEVWERTKSI